ncbi:MAG: response regulator [Melioribacteraceae bacterium]|nr:response regulator [Melioribacteraceae bacterium]
MMTQKILIVEDDPFTQQFYTYLFSKTDYEIIQTEDGDKILQILDEEEITLIIMDINLTNTYWEDEKVDGVFISKFLKNNESYANIPILLVTAYQKKTGTKDIFEESCADEYIVKPITDFNELLGKIKQLINE